VAVVLWFVDHPWALLVIIATVGAVVYRLSVRRRRMNWSKKADHSNPV
jgi:hypothetical protein